MTEPWPKPERVRKGKKQFLTQNAKIPHGRKPIRKSPYLHPAWVKLRNKVQRRSKGRCESPTCRGTSNASHVHHLVYGVGTGWRRLIVPMTKLLHLCTDCHSAEHPLNAKAQMQMQVRPGTFLDG